LSAPQGGNANLLLLLKKNSEVRQKNMLLLEFRVLSSGVVDVVFSFLAKYQWTWITCKKDNNNCFLWHP